MGIRKMLISCIKLDHALYSINYGRIGLPELRPHPKVLWMSVRQISGDLVQRGVLNQTR